MTLRSWGGGDERKQCIIIGKNTEAEFLLVAVNSLSQLAFALGEVMFAHKANVTRTPCWVCCHSGVQLNGTWFRCYGVSLLCNTPAA